MKKIADVMKATGIAKGAGLVLAMSLLLVLSGCPKQVETPDVVGMQVDLAADAIVAAKLAVDPATVDVYCKNVAAEVVVSQRPVAGDLVAKKTPVVLTVSLGALVPNWASLDEAEWKAAFAEAGLVVTTTGEYSDDVPKGRLISHSLQDAEIVSPGAAVKAVVSKGPEPVGGALVYPPAGNQVMPLAVDGLGATVNVDLSGGSMTWFSFNGTKSESYHVVAKGNAPVVVKIFAEGQDPDGNVVAGMLWSTDPFDFELAYWPHYWWEYSDNGWDVAAPAAEKAVSVPSFVAPATAKYYVAIQAARVLDCTDDCADGWQDLDYSIFYPVNQVTVGVYTVATYEDAVELKPVDLADDSVDHAFVAGEVSFTKTDWFYFDSPAASNYMIEFRLTELLRSGSYIVKSNDAIIKATVYGPNGDVVCESFGCTVCEPTDLYVSMAGKYYIAVEVADAPDWSGQYPATSTSSMDEDLAGTGSPEYADYEWGVFKYMLRVVDDDHGNNCGLATVAQAPDMNAVVDVDGYLSYKDRDYMKFAAAPRSTYRVQTNNELFGVAISACDGFCGVIPNIDAVGNQSAVVQNTGNVAENVGFGLSPIYTGDYNFFMEIGAYTVSILGDDHVDNYELNKAKATKVALGTETAGTMWICDTDLFAIEPTRAPLLYKVTSKNALALSVEGSTSTWNPITTPDDNSLVQYTSASETDEDGNLKKKYAVVSAGGNMEIVEQDYTLLVEEDDHINAMPVNDKDTFAAAVAEASALEAGVAAGVLWTEADSDMFKLEVPVAEMGKVHAFTVNDGLDVSFIVDPEAEGLSIASGTEVDEETDVRTIYVLVTPEDVEEAEPLTVLMVVSGAEDDDEVAFEVKLAIDEESALLPAAKTIGAGELWKAIGSVADVDAFKVTLKKDDDKKIELQGVDLADDVSFTAQLLDEDGNVLQTVTFDEDASDLVMPVATEETVYYVTVTGADAGKYTMTKKNNTTAS